MAVSLGSSICTRSLPSVRPVTVSCSLPFTIKPPSIEKLIKFLPESTTRGFLDSYTALLLWNVVNEGKEKKRKKTIRTWFRHCTIRPWTDSRPSGCSTNQLGSQCYSEDQRSNISFRLINLLWSTWLSFMINSSTLLRPFAMLERRETSITRFRLPAIVRGEGIANHKRFRAETWKRCIVACQRVLLNRSVEGIIHERKSYRIPGMLKKNSKKTIAKNLRAVTFIVSFPQYLFFLEKR